MVESHDAGTYKNEDAYRMLSKMQKGAYEEFTEFKAAAEVFVERKAEQVEKEANKKRWMDGSTVHFPAKKRHGKKNRGKGRK